MPNIPYVEHNNPVVEHDRAVVEHDKAVVQPDMIIVGHDSPFARQKGSCAGHYSGLSWQSERVFVEDKCIEVLSNRHNFQPYRYIKARRLLLWSFWIHCLH